MANVCTQSSNRRLSDRSATRPAKAPMNSTGPNCAAASSPRAKPLSVSFSTRSVCAISVSQLPDLGDELAGEEQAEVADPEGVEGLAASCAGDGSRRGPPRPGRRGRRAPPRAARGRRGRARRMRPVSQAVLRWRDSSSRARPASVSATRTNRRSPGSTARATRPIDSSLATTLVIEGGATFSWSARAPRVSGPSRSMTASADSWLGVSPASASWRNRRARRVALNRSLAASSSSACAAVGAGGAAGRRGHDLYFTNLISLPNHHRGRRPRPRSAHRTRHQWRVRVTVRHTPRRPAAGLRLGEPEADGQTRSTAAPANWAL